MTVISGRQLLLPVSMFIYYTIRDLVLPITSSQFSKEYDYIIVGAGTAGSVIANRLSEDKSVSVLLLEAGGNEPVAADVPLFAVFLQTTPYDWDFAIEPQNDACYGTVEKRCRWPCGKGLGGSTMINHLIYSRGNRRDFDGWEREGAYGWGWKDVFPYFLKSEDNKDPYIVANGYHGKNGYLSVETPKFITPLAQAFIEAGKYLSYPIVDINGPQQTGFTIPQGITHRGMRFSTNRAFLDVTKNRKNIDIVIFAFVTKILFDDKKTAKAVQFDHLGKRHIVNAKREIIVSAGTVNSPKLLMLSGIGLKEELGKHGIPVIADLPVGLNLQDHVTTFGLNFLIDDPVAVTTASLRTVREFTRFLLGKPSVLNSLIGLEGMSLIHSRFSNHSIDYPDAQFSLLVLSPTSDGGRLARLLRTTDEVWNTVYKPFKFRHSFSFLPTGLRPLSRGYLTLRSENPYDYPIIEPRYFSNEQDLLTVVDAMKIALSVVDTPPFRKFGVRPFPTTLPGCENCPKLSDEYLACVAKAYTQSHFHPVGTCKMGALDDPTAVVDPELRVIGVSGLRVADASIMPNIVSANTMASVVMIGEKVSDMIKRYHWTKRQGSL